MKNLRKYSMPDLTSKDIDNVFLAQLSPQPPFRITEL